MKKLINVVSAIAFLCMGCQKDNDLSESIMIYDKVYTNLPAYSEWGYNTFGAYYDREIFISNDSKIPVKVIVTNNETSFIFTGQKNWSEMIMTLTMSNFAPASYKDMLLLNDTIIDLTKPENKIALSVNSKKYTPEILTGTFQFKRAQNLIVDKKQTEVILSGYFRFQMRIADQEYPITVSEGRFDVGISPDNVYIY